MHKNNKYVNEIEKKMTIKIVCN